MTLKERIKRLETRVEGNCTVLTMPDGSKRTIRRDLMAIFGEAQRGERSPELEAIAASTGAEEAGGGRLCELIRVYLHGPISDQAEDVTTHEIGGGR